MCQRNPSLFLLVVISLISLKLGISFRKFVMYKVRQAEPKDRKEFEILLKNFSEEHQEWEGQDQTGEEFDSSELDLYCWLSSSDKKQEDKKPEKTFVPFLIEEHKDHKEKTKTTKICGIAVLMKQEKETQKEKEKEKRWHILEFVIHPDYRKQGLGRKFVDGLKTLHCGYFMETASHVKNVDAKKFWNKMGFQTVKENVSFSDRSIYGVGKFDIHIFIE